MKAALWEKPDVMAVRDVPEPKCDPDGLLIRVAACAVCGTDVKILHHGHRLIVPPRVTGHEVAGEVVEVGKNVKGFKTGDRIAVAPAVPCGECITCRKGYLEMCDNLTAVGYHYDGGFAEYMAVPPQVVRIGCVNRVPDGVSYEEAALAEPLACCINAQELAFVRLGRSVAIVGAGPIGCLNTQLARANGATQVILTDISSERLEMSAFVKPDLMIDASKEDATKTIMDATSGQGADVVIVACSSGKAQEQSLEMVAKCGVVNFFGGLPKDAPFIRFNSNLVHYRQFYVVGNHGSAPRHNRLALGLIAAGKIDVKNLITHRMPVERTVEAIEITEAAKGLKVIVSPAS